MPEGYYPFIYNGGFYVRQNCSISTENDCCPPGYSFDGANCNSGVIVPPDFDWFIYNNHLFTVPYCFEDEEITTKEDLCDEINELSGREEGYLNTWQMTGAGILNLCFDPRCVPDQLIVTVDGVQQVNTGSMSNACTAFCGTRPIDDCSSSLNLTCDFEPKCFAITWDACSNITIQVIGNTCNTDITTFWELDCYPNVEYRSSSPSSIKEEYQREDNIKAYCNTAGSLSIMNNSEEIDYIYQLYTINGSLFGMQGKISA